MSIRPSFITEKLKATLRFQGKGLFKQIFFRKMKYDPLLKNYTVDFPSRNTEDKVP